MNKYSGKKIPAAIAGLFVIPCLGWADQSSLYCPQNRGYISPGMTTEQVTAACGEPISKQNSNHPLMQQIPMTQLLYNNMGAPKAFYGVWALPIGDNTPGNPPFGGNSGGSQLQVDIVNNKVRNISLNGSSSNAFSVCNGAMIKVGDPAGLVYGACGTPSLVNNSYINQPVPSLTKPQIWVYQPGKFQPSVSLTFVDGKLQSID